MASSNDRNPDLPAIVLFRHDLRLADNRALREAADTGKPLVLVFVFDEMSEGIRKLGGARRWWLHHSLDALTKSIGNAGGKLILRAGPMVDVVLDLVEETGADMVFWNRRYDPPAIAADKDMKKRLDEQDIATASFEGHLLHEPWQIRTGSGGFYKVYSPFWRALVAASEPRAPVSRPQKLRAFAKRIQSDELADWKLLPTRPDWAGGLRETWTPGEDAAHAALNAFLSSPIDGYGENRDRPDLPSTSRLSPHLAHGEITPFQIWHALETRKVGAPASDVEKFRKEVAWREFSYHLLFHNPDLGRTNFNRDFDDFPWKGGTKTRHAWQQGQTGYPLIDAGMRELWQTGWVHNRVRMVAASFLVKHLLQDWRLGEEWFWDTLVDADPASNTANWQWVAGSGADAAPYFRVFNPILQGVKFDPDATYVHKFVPELDRLAAKETHEPWKGSPEALSKAGVKLGETYPVPVVEHSSARDQALQAYKDMKGHS
ncbi:deoxyribodipyrimidine photo-lyase [Aliihoeflea aestuarii]|uniref:cryptochrome/photolyase family protein n=1 Tax=Aliihoeflea aestuarii TaxID=453840 RepID=UPI002091FBCE|nr:deoxyribodipyrimidine photo-lyase [Aliihoeflea aestuarii]MCO6390569.1 deoxyribodipyrimidine photo-lyase [Aliihoeflea aestuarii]